MDVLLGEITLGQEAFVQDVGEGTSPVDVERLPVTVRCERRMKVVEQRHGNFLRGYDVILLHHIAIGTEL
jgi:hypothetical protein